MSAADRTSPLDIRELHARDRDLLALLLAGCMTWRFSALDVLGLDVSGGVYNAFERAGHERRRVMPLRYEDGSMLVATVYTARGRGAAS